MAGALHVESPLWLVAHNRRISAVLHKRRSDAMFGTDDRDGHQRMAMSSARR